MPDYTDYPTTEDIEVLMKSVGAWPSDTTAQAFATEQASICVAGSIKEWERRTGWIPFKKQSTDTTREYTQTDPYGYLDLKAGILSVTSVVVGTETYTVNDDFKLMRLNSAQAEYPFDGIRFRNPINAYNTYPVWETEIEVTGKWGFSEEIPADAWKAILRQAGVDTLSQLENQQDIASISQDGFTKAFDVVGVITQKDLLTEWNKIFDKIVGLYRRVTV